MFDDPFADSSTPAPADETPDVPAESPWEPETTNDKKEIVINAQSEGKLTVTLKGDGSYSSPWIVVYANDAEDGVEQLRNPALRELMTLAASAGKYFAGLVGEGKPAPTNGGGTGNGGARKGQPAGATKAPGGETQYCSHGEMDWKEWTRESDGKHFRGFFCSSKDRDDQCKPQFRNKK